MRRRLKSSERIKNTAKRTRTRASQASGVKRKVGSNTLKSNLTKFASGRSGLHAKRNKRSRMGYTPYSRIQNSKKASNPVLIGVRGFIIKASAISAITMLLIFIVGVLGVIGLVSAYSKDLPDLDEYFAKQKKDGKESIIYDRTGNVVLRKIRGDKIKIRVKIKDVPDRLKWAYLVTEDDDFYNHKGLDYVRLSGALFCYLKGETGCGGASTITQQVIKKTTDDDEASLDRKIREAISAMEIENKWEKDTILEFYLNLVPMGGVVEGVQAGSIYLFNKPNLSDLSLAEMAIMAAIPNQPDVLSPLGTAYSSETLIKRASYILSRLEILSAKTGVSKEEVVEAKTELKNMTFTTDQYFINFQDFKAYHFTNYVLSDLAKAFDAEIPQELKDKGEGVERYLGDKGYKIITTVDLRYQKIVEETIKSQIATEAFQQSVGAQNAAAVIMDPKSGQILSMVGSKDFREPSSEDKKFDPEVNVALKDRSMGSTMKPILYLAAFERGHTANSVLPDMPLDLRSPGATEEYRPQNYDRGAYRNDLISIRESLKYSLNIPAVSAYYLVGGENYADTYVRLNGWEPIRERMYPSAPLGAANIPLLEQTHAYNTIAGGGIRYPKISILRVEDANGNIIKSFEGVPGERTVAEKHIVMINELNKRYHLFDWDNVLQNIQNNITDIAGKTGTSDNSEGRPGDTTFIAYTPSISFGMWAGNNCGADQCPLTGSSATGESLYQNMYKIALQRMIDEGLLGTGRFPTSAVGLTSVGVCPLTGRLASTQCPGVNTLADVNQLPPAEDMFRTVEVTRCGDSYKLARGIDRELGLVEIVEFFNYTFPYKFVADQVNSRVGKGSPPTEVCDIPRQINPPTVRILSPASQTSVSEGQVIFIEADVVKTLDIAKVELSVNGSITQTKLSPPYSFSINADSLNLGSNTIEVIATDIRGNRGRGSIQISKPTEITVIEPTVSMLSPTSNQIFLKGTPIAVSAALNLGTFSQSDIGNADIQVVNNAIGVIAGTYAAQTSSLSVQGTASTNSLDLGEHTIRIRVIIKGKLYQASVIVKIQ